MTSQQQPYSHGGHGPGPSYYHPPPPAYGSSSPGPHPHYAYQYPPQPPPHMNSHPSGPSRPNARGGGSYNPRTQPHNPYAYYPPYGHHPGPVPMQNPSLHSYPRNQPYSPSYGHLNPAAVPFTPPRQNLQPLSPLSKGPGTSTPPLNPAGFYEQQEFTSPTQVPSQIPIMSPQAQKPLAPIPPVSELSEGPSEPIAYQEVNPTPSFLPEVEQEQNETLSPESFSPIVATQPILDTQSGIVPLQEFSFLQNSITSATPESSSDLPSEPPTISWTIWSRRPSDPSHAPGIIISPRACPPGNILEGAVDTKTPPISPPSSPVILKKTVLPSVSRDVGLLEAVSSQTSSTVPSSAGTENADTPTIPGSPVSTNTSISTSAVPAADPILDVKASNAVQADSQVAVTVEEVVKPTVDAPAKDEGILIPSGGADASSSLQPSTSDADAAAPLAASTAPSIPPKKKLWASLFRPAASSGATTPAKNSLPTSSIVGFSIPAGDDAATLASPVSPSKKSELVNLLTGNSSAARFVSKIRPRGLVNSGNMCFANSVLQILVYCPPFHRLFVELGKLLPGVAAEKETVWAGAPSLSTAPVPVASSTAPLVDATALFLKEFLTGKKVSNNGKPGLMSGIASGSGYGRGKGKERELLQLEEDDWDGDSFLPTYIYDAMKEKKRFDSMRGGQQEDAEEFLGFYLDTLEEELLSLLSSVNPSQPSKPVVEEHEGPVPKEDGWMEVGKKNRSAVTRTIKATESPITRIFGGKFRSTLRAPRQKDSVIVEDWRSLRLDIQRDQIRTIQDALSYISHPQPVQVSISTQPGVPVEATQQVLIEALPPILVLHIKRFCYDTNVKGVVKVGKQVLFGPELEIGAELMAPAAKKTGPTKYKLFGAVYHHGLSASGGHYTLDVLHPNRYPNQNPANKSSEGWVRIDDDLISDVRPEDVFGAQERDDTRCAYLLFYRRV